MAIGRKDPVHRQIQRLFGQGTLGGFTDGELLERFVSRRDGGADSAFEALVTRHGPMVFRVCRDVLDDSHDAEDAFQATFLVLARRAHAIRRRDSVASWLYGVARRVASKAKTGVARRRGRERRAAAMSSEGDLPGQDRADFQTLHEEIDRLPEKFRAPVVLCYLEGYSHELAAGHLGVTEGAIRGRTADRVTLKYGDGEADGKKSLGGSGEMIEFTVPEEGQQVAGVRIHGSRYGMPDPPQERFLIFFLNHDLSAVVGTRMAPYSLFERGPEQWVEVTFSRPIDVPKRFWIALDFRAHQSKGVYVSYDTSTGGKHSRIGLPGIQPKPTDADGDWMIEALLAK